MRRREFISLLGGAAAACPLAARAQQPTLPIVGFVGGVTADLAEDRGRAFRQGLSDAGFVEGRNVAVEYHWLGGQYDQVPSTVADLVRRQVAVIATPGNSVAALAAKAVTSTIPIVFGVTEDPERIGLVANLARPGSNATGISYLGAEISAKRLGLLHDLVPRAVRMALLVNPANAPITEPTLRDTVAAAGVLGLKTRILQASSVREIEAAFATLAAEPADALFVGNDALFSSRRVHLAILATHYGIPAAYSNRDFVAAGGLMSYGTELTGVYRQVGLYTGRILKGAKPAELPVIQSSKFELAINLATARVLGLSLPGDVLSIADEVIE
jgi:putative ABC transport system substrate-binding protein